MARGKKTKGMVILLFLVPTLANAALTMNGLGGDFIESALSADLVSHDCYGPEISQITGRYNPRLAVFAAEFNKPPVSFAGSSPPDNTIKSLPGVPGALLMVFVGFLCVSMVKDRKVWLAALAGLLWAGQAGFAVLPQLALNLAGKKQSEQQYSPDIVRLCEPEYPCHLRSDIEGTSYIGLLRHLAGIPGTAASLLPRIAVRDQLQQESEIMTKRIFCRIGCFNTYAQSVCRPKTFAVFDCSYHRLYRYLSKSPHLAIKGLSPCPNRTIDCLALRAGRPVSFSPSFIFTSLARGPPTRT